MVCGLLRLFTGDVCLNSFGQYPAWPMMPGRMMSQRGGVRGRAPLHAGRGGYYGGTLTLYSFDLAISSVLNIN